MTVLILSLAGASISLVLLLIDKKKDPKRRIILILASIGFLIFMGQQFLSYFSARASDQIFKNLDERTKIIKSKTTRIDSTVSVLQILVSKLGNTNIEKVGIKVQTLDNLENLHAFEKGSPEAWTTYVEWLKSPLEGERALRFVVNNGRHYNYSLVLLYLMTDGENEAYVRDVIRTYAKWHSFPKTNDWERIRNSNPECDLVLFENQQGEILGFAKTKELLKNLGQIGNKNEFTNALNNRNENFTDFALNKLPAFQLSAKGNTLEQVSRSMISENISQTVSEIDADTYYLNLSSLFELK